MYIPSSGISSDSFTSSSLRSCHNECYPSFPRPFLSMRHFPTLNFKLSWNSLHSLGQPWSHHQCGSPALAFLLISLTTAIPTGLRWKSQYKFWFVFPQWLRYWQFLFCLFDVCWSFVLFFWELSVQSVCPYMDLRTYGFGASEWLISRVLHSSFQFIGV